jgi:CheY-like chemotaxis protein
VYLPALLLANASNALPANASIGELSGIRVLLVEDEAAVRNVTDRMLTRMGCTVTAFENGAKALAYFERAFSEVDVVILDMVMPEMDGYETFVRMKQVCGGIRAILASGYSLDGVARSMMESGLLGYLQKPYTRESLARKVSEVFAPEASDRRDRGPELR